jgi:predicted heme/steroid binding protein
MSASSSVPDNAAGLGGGGADGPPPRRFTRAELARHDGSDPALPVLIAYAGKVYDVTGSFPWARGIHWGDIRAGQDLTGRLKESIHGEEMLERVPCVGVLDAAGELV